MVFKRFVEIGRVALVSFGEDEGKLCVIIDVVDQNKVLVDGPVRITGVKRQSIPLSRLALTDIVIPIQRCPRPKTLYKIFNESDVLAQWNKTSWARKREKREKRATLNDFERFQVTLARKERSKIVREEFKSLCDAEGVAE